MTETVSAVEARQRLGELLNRVALRHEEIIIERAGKPLARLSGIDASRSRDTAKLDFRKASGLGKDIWQEVEVDDYVKQERASWD